MVDIPFFDRTDNLFGTEREFCLDHPVEILGFLAEDFLNAPSLVFPEIEDFFLICIEHVFHLTVFYIIKAGATDLFSGFKKLISYQNIW